MKKYCKEITNRNFRGGLRSILALTVLMMVFDACQRRLLEYDEIYPAALIPVQIDWNATGFIVSGNNRDVHKVSIRFFPKDGIGEVFDCYLETNVSQGEIAVPTGKYSVIVFNESLQDATFWAGRIAFTDVNSYSDFTANAVLLSDAARLQQFPYYQPQPGEIFIVEPLRLASWSLPDFEVTNNMILVSQGQRPPSILTAEENTMFNALTQITMRALTRPIGVTARVENLSSARTMYFAMQGLASKVNMATGLATTPSTYLFILNGRQYESNQRNGTAQSSFLSFGRTPTPESYKIGADILLTSNELYDPAPPLLFDVTDEFNNTNISINLNINIVLPFIEGGIAVDDWGVDEQRTVKEY